MFIYIAILVLLFSFRKSQNPKVLWFCVVLLSLVCGLRGNDVGEDTERYNQYYDYVSLTDGYMEVLWNMMSYGAKLLNLSCYGFNLVVATLTMILITVVCKKETTYPVMALFFYYAFGFYLIMFNGMRQFLAISIVFVAFHYLGKRKYIIAAPTVFLASLFHASSLIAYAAFAERFYKPTKRVVVYSTVIALLLGIILPENLFISLAGDYAHDITDNYGFRGLGRALLYAGIVNTFFFLILSKLKKEDLENYWVKMFCISMLVFNVVVKLAMGPRIMYYFTVVEIVSLTKMIESVPNKKIAIYSYLFAVINFIRFLLPEIAKYGVRGSLVPYDYCISIFS